MTRSVFFKSLAAIVFAPKILTEINWGKEVTMPIGNSIEYGGIKDATLIKNPFFGMRRIKSNVWYCHEDSGTLILQDDIIKNNQQ